jgi:hypothetical protein
VILGVACSQPDHAPRAQRPIRPATADPVTMVPFRLIFFPHLVTATINGESIPADSNTQRAYQLGSRVTYTFAAVDSSATLSVRIDSVAAPATGVLVADRAHEIVAIAMPPLPPPHVAGVGRENRELYRLILEMLKSPAPVPLFQGMSDEVGCLMQWYGDQRGQQLAEDAHDKAVADYGDPEAPARLNKALGGAKIEARECTKKKPD